MRNSFAVKPTVWKMIAVRLRIWSPKLLTALILLFSVAPTYLPGYSSVRPALTLIPIFYWAVYNPDRFSVISAFLFGVALDLLDGTPLGINTFVFTVFYLLADSQRRFLNGKPFGFVWFGFVVLSLGAYFLKWLFVSINYARFTPAGIALLSWLLLLAAYPLLVFPCAKLHLYLLDKEDDNA